MIILVVLLYALFGTVFPLMRSSLAYGSPIFLTAVRMLTAGVLLLCYVYRYRKKTFVFRRAYFYHIFALSFFNIFLTNAPEAWALYFVHSAKASFIYTLTPFFTALLSYLLFAVKLGRAKLAGLLIGFVGFFPILMHESAAERSVGGISLFSWPEIALILAAISTAYGWIIMQQILKERAFTSLMANGLSMVIGGFFSLLASIIIEPWQPVPVIYIGPFLFYTLSIMVVSNLICYNLYGYLLKYYTPTFLSFANFLSPFFTAFYGWLFLAEEVTWHFFTSAIVVFIGLYVFYRQELKQGYTQPSRQ